MAKKPKQTPPQTSLKGKFQSHLMKVDQDYGDDVVKWYKSFLAASLTVVAFALLYLMGSYFNWWLVYVIAGVAALSLLFKVIFWSDGSW